MKLATSLCRGLFAVLTLACICHGPNAGADPVSEKEKSRLAEGKELFTHEWMHGDRRSHAGDGLGPVFNAQSCVACHKQGGVGGAGSKENNASLVTVFVPKRITTGLFGAPLQAVLPFALKRDSMNKEFEIPALDKLEEIHPSLGTQGSFPYHRFGIAPKFKSWRSGIISKNSGMEHREVGGVFLTLIESQRNAPALFGAGLIDGIPDQVLIDAAAEQMKAYRLLPEIERNPDGLSSEEMQFANRNVALPVKGRVARLKDNRIGRFGWKGSVATLREFTLQACSQELGLEVPGLARAIPPWNKDYKAPGIDLTAEQCDSLTFFVSSLSKPVERPPGTPEEAAIVVNGRKLFSSVGCAACHLPKLGDVDGIYSDLLLHDMGPVLSDAGSYTVINPEVASRQKSKPTVAEEQPQGATALEWRTPPLWGLHDSAPYLHDGRAGTIARAIALHRGEGLASALAFSKLKWEERQQIEQFLMSLAAPWVPQ
jgi:CxxC motif-containing protein (DUF1111 family)